MHLDGFNLEYENIAYQFGTKNYAIDSAEYRLIQGGENPSRILEKRFLKTSPFSRILAPKQVHGDSVHIIRTEKDISKLMDSNINADGLITSLPNIALAVITADCLPVFLFEPKKKVVGVFHAGWRSTVEKIVIKGVRIMEESFGVRAGDIFALLGPSIGPCCFEIGEDVKEKIAASGIGKALLPSSNKKYFFDLSSANRFELISAGCERILLGNMCTKCKKDLFYSYRGDEKERRMVNIIGIL